MVSIVGVPKTLNWVGASDEVMCHINHCSWIKIANRNNGSGFKIVILQNLYDIINIDNVSFENKFDSVESAQNFVQAKYDEFWVSLSDFKTIRG